MTEGRTPTTGCCCRIHSNGYFCMECPIHGIKPPAGEPAPAPAQRPVDEEQIIADARRLLASPACSPGHGAHLRDLLEVIAAARRQLAEAQADNARLQTGYDEMFLACERAGRELIARDAQLGALREAAQEALIPIAALKIAECHLWSESALTLSVQQALIAAHDKLLAALAAGGPEPQEPS